MRQPQSTFDEGAVRSDQYDSDMGVAPEVDPDIHEQFDAELNATNDGVGGPMGDAEGMDEDTLLTMVQQEIALAAGAYNTEISQIRINSMEMYAGVMPSAPSGRSQAVSTDVADVVEWTMPQVMTALTGTQDVVTFDAVSEEDEEQALLETDAVQHVLHKENDGFVYLYSLCKDALIERNGIGKVYWDDPKKVCIEEYTGLTEREAMQLLEPGDGSTVTPLEYDEREAGPGVLDMQAMQQQQMQQQQMQPQPGQPPQPPEPIPLMVYDLKIRRVTSTGKATILALPPEEFLFNRDHPSIDLTDARFTDHRREETESALIAAGWDRELVESLPAYGTVVEDEKQVRFNVDGEEIQDGAQGSVSLKTIMVHECYLLADVDGDGIAEITQVWCAGDDGEVYMGHETVDCNPFVGTTGILMTHKFMGHSLWDRVREIQHQKTEVLRQIQDNLKHQNNSRLLVVAGQVNLDDMLTSRPGGIVRQKQPGMVEPLVAPQIGDLGYKQLEYLDNVRTGRAGVSPDSASVAEAIAGDTAHGLERLMTAKEELTGLMIRLFANTAVKNTAVKVRALLQKHRDTPMHFKVRDNWQSVNPSEWKNRTGMTVSTALSTGDRNKLMQGLNVIITQQTTAVQNGGLGTLVTEKNIYNALTDFVRASPVGDPSPYWQDPDSDEAKRAAEAKRKQAEEAQAKQDDMARSMVEMQGAIEGNKEATKRLKIESDNSQAMSKLIEEHTSALNTLEQKYTELELKYQTDIVGQGQEPPGPSTPPSTGP